MNILRSIGEIVFIAVLFFAALALSGHSIERADAAYRAEAAKADEAPTAACARSLGPSEPSETCLQRDAH